MEKKQTKFYTGQGDKGLTALTPAAQVSKADERVAAVGSVEEIISALGVVKVESSCPIFRGKLERIQKTLRTLSEGLRDPRSGKYVFSAEEIDFLESDMDKMLEVLSPDALTQPLPGGNPQSPRPLRSTLTACRITSSWPPAIRIISMPRPRKIKCKLPRLPPLFRRP